MEQEHKEQTNTALEVISKIEHDNVTPIARWHFALKNSGFWSLWGISVLIGSCAMAATIFTFIHSGWQYRAITHDTFIKFFFDVTPLFWFISLGAMVLFGYYNIRHTSRGYRFSFAMIVVASVVASFIGGTILYTLGIARDIDDIRRPLPFSSPIGTMEESRWNNFDRGLIAGEILEFAKGDTVVILKLFSGGAQSISLLELDEISLSKIQPGAQVRIIGKAQGTVGSDPFIACVVLPWEMSKGRPFPEQPLVKEKINERNPEILRSSICKDVRPYQRYKEVFITK